MSNIFKNSLRDRKTGQACPCCLAEADRLRFFFDDYIECSGCGLVYKDKNQSAQQIIEHYEVVDPNENVAISKESFFSDALATLREASPANRKLLDVGCGAGDFLALAKNAGFLTYGVEISGVLAGKANEKLARDCVFTGKLDESNYLEKNFGAVSIWDALVYSENPYADLRECCRILDTDGVIGIRVRNSTFQKWIRKLYLKFYRLAHMAGIKNPSVFHNFSFSKSALESVLRRSGFCSIRVLNSPLSSGDPYRHARIRAVTILSKKVVTIVTDLIFRVSRGRLVLGPSLLVWARKAK